MGLLVGLYNTRFNSLTGHYCEEHTVELCTFCDAQPVKVKEEEPYFNIPVHVRLHSYQFTLSYFNRLIKDIILNTMKKESCDLQKYDLKPEIVPNLMYSQNPLWVK